MQQPRIDPASAGGDWAGYGVVTGPQFLALCQQDKVSFLFGNDSVLLWVQRADGVAGVYRLVDTPVQPAQLAPTTNPASVEPAQLSSELDKLWTYQQLKPLFSYYAQKYGFDPLVLAAICRQESGFKNWRVHLDGTGYGLFGLDDNGMLPAFEQWSGLSVGRGSDHKPTTPNQQIEYTAMQLRKYQDQLGSAILAAQAWHRGLGAYTDDRGQAYGETIKGHMAYLATQ